MLSCPNDSANLANYEERNKSSHNSLRKLYLAIGLCSSFMIIEILGGYWANSLSIISDAVHLLSGTLCFNGSLITKQLH